MFTFLKMLLNKIREMHLISKRKSENIFRMRKIGNQWITLKDTPLLKAFRPSSSALRAGGHGLFDFSDTMPCLDFCF